MPFERTYDPNIEEVAAAFPRFDVADISATRARLDELLRIWKEEGLQRPSDPNVEEIDRSIPGPDGNTELSIRIYMPRDRQTTGPAFVYFHGGGFVLGDLEAAHPRSLVMAARAGTVAVSVDYRLAPEHPFPAGLEDCYAALRWVVEHAPELKIEPEQIVIGGDSAGGNLAAAVALLARDRAGPSIALQMLFYPAIDDRCTTQSMMYGAGLYIWDYQNSVDMWNHYLGENRDNVSPYASPARATDLAGLPPAFIVTAEHDPLRDEAVFYAINLMNAGVPVELHNYPGTVHGFDLMAPSDLTSRAIEDSVRAFQRAVR